MVVFMVTDICTLQPRGPSYIRITGELLFNVDGCEDMRERLADILLAKFEAYDKPVLLTVEYDEAWLGQSACLCFSVPFYGEPQAAVDFFIEQLKRVVPVEEHDSLFASFVGGTD